MWTVKNWISAQLITAGAGGKEKKDLSYHLKCNGLKCNDTQKSLAERHKRRDENVTIGEMPMLGPTA
jgi:hypothetical protein